jgi:hypothetical protein
LQPDVKNSIIIGHNRETEMSDNAPKRSFIMTNVYELIEEALPNGNADLTPEMYAKLETIDYALCNALDVDRQAHPDPTA